MNVAPKRMVLGSLYPFPKWQLFTLQVTGGLAVLNTD